MVRLLTKIRNRLRWLHWFFFDCPNIFKMYDAGADRDSRRIAFARWHEREPVEGRPGKKDRDHD